MRFSYYFPGRWMHPQPDLLTGAAHARLARAAEEAGFDGAAFDEHPAPPEIWRRQGGHDAFDPFVALAFVAGTTNHLQLLTYVTVLPYRNPLVLAKAVASLDVLSEGRLTLGLGTGYLPEEFAAVGASFERRNEVFDEALEALELAWTGDAFSFEGRDFEAVDVITHPPPRQKPHPPIWLAGNSRLTRRRVVARAQGWMPMPNPRRQRRGWHRTPPLETLEDLEGMLAMIRSESEAAGRSEPIDIAHSLALGAPPVSEPEALVEHIGRLAELGVTWVTVNGAGAGVEEAEEWIRHYGEAIIDKVRPKTSS